MLCKEILSIYFHLLRKFLRIKTFLVIFKHIAHDRCLRAIVARKRFLWCATDVDKTTPIMLLSLCSMCKDKASSQGWLAFTQHYILFMLWTLLVPAHISHQTHYDFFVCFFFYILSSTFVILDVESHGFYTVSCHVLSYIIQRRQLSAFLLLVTCGIKAVFFPSTF